MTGVCIKKPEEIASGFRTNLPLAYRHGAPGFPAAQRFTRSNWIAAVRVISNELPDSLVPVTINW